MPATMCCWIKTSEEIMGVRHRMHPIEGVQFHPEGLLTEHGHDMLRNFLHEFADFAAPR